jgi:predicted GNAT family acetyltransferase
MPSEVNVTTMMMPTTIVTKASSSSVRVGFGRAVVAFTPPRYRARGWGLVA